MAEKTENPNDGKPAGEQGGGDRTFTQAEVDALIKERLGRTKAQYADYDDLKAKAQAWAEYEEKQKSELQKANERATKAETERQAALQTAQERMVKATFIAEAAGLNVKRPQDAYALAKADGLQFEVTGDSVSGVKEAVQALVNDGRLPLTTKPTAPDLNAGAGSGERPGDKPAALSEEEKAFARKMGISDEAYAKYKSKGA